MRLAAGLVRFRQLRHLLVDLLQELDPFLRTVARQITGGSKPGSGRCGLKRHRSARILAAGHAFVQNLRGCHYDIATDVQAHHRLRIAFDDLAITI
jgi:hypothetical protein